MRGERDKAIETALLESDFLATASHEIRNAMNGLQGLSGMLLATALDDVQRSYADGILTSAEALLGIVNDILDYSKIESGKLELEERDFDLAVTIEGVTNALAPAVAAKDLELVTELGSDVPRALRGDAGRLRQVLLNLAGNAVKFTATGVVTIRVIAMPHARAHERASLRIEIQDTGIGIADGDAERLFERFAQASASTTRQYGGTGLGLPICARLVEAMDGSIGVDSQEGRGSVFWIELAFERATASTPRVPTPDPGQVVADREGDLLIVEDNAINQFVARAMVRSLGFRCDVAANGLEALDALAGHTYSAVLMDCSMPEMDGFSATVELRAREGDLRHTPIIAMTGATTERDRQRCAEAGMDDCVTKPIDVKRLASVLDQWTQTRAVA
jgi:CheY-like chemotaxis protein